jgi:hypothetical protein
MRGYSLILDDAEKSKNSLFAAQSLLQDGTNLLKNNHKMRKIYCFMFREGKRTMLELIKEAHCVSSITVTLQKFSNYSIIRKRLKLHKLLKTAPR